MSRLPDMLVLSLLILSRLSPPHLTATLLYVSPGKLLNLFETILRLGKLNKVCDNKNHLIY